MYLSRTLEHFAGIATGQFPVLLVTGARQVGKTTLLRHISEDNRTYITLDDPLLLDLARRDPALFFQRFRPPLIIDEIQYAPELLPYIKMEADNSGRSGLFWLTGSQQFHLMKGVSESLAGRVAVVQLLGLSRRELIGQSQASLPLTPTASEIAERVQSGGHLDLRELYSLIWRGAFPAIALDKARDWNLYYASYVQTYLQRDVRDLSKVGDEMAFLRFLRISAARTGQMLNLSELARDADIAVNTAKSWLSILQASGVAYLLEPYHNNISKRMVKSPKLYFLDTGLCAYLTGWSSPETLEAGAMSGAIFETWVVSELIKSYWHNGRQAPLYYYRDKEKREIDVVILQNGTVYPLEIKKTASPTSADVRHFQVLEKLKMPVGPGGVICLAQQSLPLSPSAVSIPVAAL
ncbi:MAG: ATP-binding protein [bacterium]|nr:ATP-binding protein [bacterium]